MKNPCKYCDKRNATCHAVCPDYKQFEKENAKVRQKRIDEHAIDDVLYEYKAERHNRFKNGNYGLERWRRRRR